MRDRKVIFLLLSWALVLALIAAEKLPSVLAALALTSFLVHAMSLRTAPPVGEAVRPQASLKGGSS
jgi:hypothetical protein